MLRCWIYAAETVRTHWLFDSFCDLSLSLSLSLSPILIPYAGTQTKKEKKINAIHMQMHFWLANDTIEKCQWHYATFLCGSHFFFISLACKLNAIFWCIDVTVWLLNILLLFWLLFWIFFGLFVCVSIHKHSYFSLALAENEEIFWIFSSSSFIHQNIKCVDSCDCISNTHTRTHTAAYVNVIRCLTHVNTCIFQQQPKWLVGPRLEIKYTFNRSDFITNTHHAMPCHAVQLFDHFSLSLLTYLTER